MKHFDCYAHKMYLQQITVMLKSDTITISVYTENRKQYERIFTLLRNCEHILLCWIICVGLQANEPFS